MRTRRLQSDSLVADTHCEGPLLLVLLAEAPLLGVREREGKYGEGGG